ncbi:MAG: DinB family protein [Caldilinea sp.]
MKLKESIMGAAASLFIERPGRAKSYDEWKEALAANGAAIDARAASAKDPVQASKMLRHISGIERWGQRRLRILLGEPLIVDEYDSYRPGTDFSLDEQRAFFRKTRTDTLTLVDQLKAARIGDDVTAPHNDFGSLTARGWLRYLDIHASMESKKIRQR